MFGASAAASLAGAGVHGLSASRDDPGRLVLWRASLAMIGLAGLSAWQVGAALALQRRLASVLLVPVLALYAAYLTVVMRTRAPFRLALAIYAPSALFLRVALIRSLRRDGERAPAALGLVSLTVSTAAAAMQVRGVAINQRWFDHNATFHSVQGIAFALLYAAARGLVRGASSDSNGSETASP